MSIFFYISFIPLALGIALAGLVIYWDHKRDMALIEKGLYQPLSRPRILRQGTGQGFLAWGLVITGIGVALFVGSFWVGMTEVELGGLVVAFIAIVLMILSAVIRRPGRLIEKTVGSDKPPKQVEGSKTNVEHRISQKGCCYRRDSRCAWGWARCGDCHKGCSQDDGPNDVGDDGGW